MKFRFKKGDRVSIASWDEAKETRCFDGNGNHEETIHGITRTEYEKIYEFGATIEEDLDDNDFVVNSKSGKWFIPKDLIRCYRSGNKFKLDDNLFEI